MEEKHWWFLARRKIVLELARRAVPPSLDKTVVDFGCGTGGNLAAFAEDYRCVGLDPAAEAVSEARRRFPWAQFIHGVSPEQTEAACSGADLLLLMDVLEHVRDDRDLLLQLVSPLKTGAHILITVPAEMSLWSPHDVSFGHFRRYDQPGLEKLWKGLPLRPLLVSYYNAHLYPLVRCARTLARLRGKAAGEAGTDFKLPPPPINRMLEKIFGSEAGRLLDRLEGRRTSGYRRGVSLIAVLRKERG